MSKVKDIYVNFLKTTHQIWSCHVTSTSNFENFYFFPNSVLNLGKLPIWGEIAQEQKLQAKNKLGGGKHPPLPNAYRARTATFRKSSQIRKMF